MKKLIQFLSKTHIPVKRMDWLLYAFRSMVSLELMIVHGFKKIGLGITTTEIVPNPYHLPESLNQGFAILANLLFPIMVIFGFLTRLAVIPILMVTISGYFAVHWHDSLLVKDVPFMYSTAFLFILFSGPGRISVDHYLFKKYTYES
ncbi:DoxX family protein [Robertkochia solimangrovi]|uniref:DoxX family protein n=1 Tax=Robertkochia solimangrovi TaxID=2213046 RepID=UPI00117DB820|nr:DoxX family protein [Robertkochia solimangrovi]TRZ43559.1 DoxX family protein [Robertkochia solimangrovi]